MEIQSFQVKYAVVGSYKELPDSDRSLFEKAIHAMAAAHAPYSQFRVGAAVLLDDGTVVLGSNQENMAYPSGLCAERVALFAAAATHPGKKIDSLAVVADPKGPSATVSPCGSCRQVMMEYQRLQSGPFRVITGALQGSVFVLDDVQMLLPLAFFDANLTKKGTDAEG